MNRLGTLVMLRGVVCLVGMTASTLAVEPGQLFEAKIRPVLYAVCFSCHGDTQTSGELRVDSRDALLRGGESGPAIAPGDPEASLLILAIQRHSDASAMPPDEEQALRPDQVADFVAWIRSGAVWPESSEEFESAGHWAFEPLREVAPPKVENAEWSASSIDRFIKARQEAAGAALAPRADRLTLIRRATFDLTGLPPSPEEVSEFLQDDSSDAYERLIERLLASPAYGERWGRHWLDVVRYADTAGETADYPTPAAWRYRNYVIDAFNADKPYDEFLREQIAGDVLADAGEPEKYAEQVTATGYLAISRRFGFDSENYHHLTIQDTIDTVGQSVLGLSLGCARCHNHKFDPVTMRDYYALYGVFDSSRYAFPGSEQKQKVRTLVSLEPPTESTPKWREFERKTAALAAALARRGKPVPNALLRSLDDVDGDFELQAPAAGGSNGVLVSPWHYEGTISVQTEAQSPFKNVYPSGRVGVSIAANSGAYRITQAIRPQCWHGESDPVYVNLDFRVHDLGEPTQGSHRFSLGSLQGETALEVLLDGQHVSLRTGATVDVLGPSPVDQWQNLQLKLDVKRRVVSGRWGSPGAVQAIAEHPLNSNWSGELELVAFESVAGADARRPAVEYDHFAIQATEFAPVATEAPELLSAAESDDEAKLTEQLRDLTGIDGDFELQVAGAPPTQPWNPGPNSVVQLSTESQSPFQNIYGPGSLGIHLPNRGEYDGLGLTLPEVPSVESGRLYVSFDIRCASQATDAAGTWRFYVGHGPGSSAALELFIHGDELVRRTGDSYESAASLTRGQWGQVRLALDLSARSYTGVLVSAAGAVDFAGALASDWDGTIDYLFIDSYGHVGGVRPALDVDNFFIGDQPSPVFDAPPPPAVDADVRGARIAEIRRQLTALEAAAEQQARELESLLASGPVPSAYGMAEGTPHNVRIQLRGEPDQPGEEAPRGFIAVLGQSELPADVRGSGRLELAEWLTGPVQHLTARVMANRVWQYHFGQGLAKTPNDFGVRGLPPTHPELLDHLAATFIRNGWSIKSLHREIMCSATYQQAAAQAEDSNDLYVGFQRRRLSAEEIRDAVLAVCGVLDRAAARGHPFPPPTQWNFTQHGPFAAVYSHQHRSVYLMVQRLKRHPFLALFDGADPNASTPVRLETTVPTQALFFLNDPLIHSSADAWAARLYAACPNDAKRIDLAWRQAFGRLPDEVERGEATQFLQLYQDELAAAGAADVESTALAAYLRMLLGSNAFLHVD